MKCDISRNKNNVRVKIKDLNPLTLKGKPRKTHFLTLGENLDLVLEMVDAKHKQPKVLRLE